MGIDDGDELPSDGESQPEEEQARATRPPTADKFAAKQRADTPHHDFRNLHEQDAGASGAAQHFCNEGRKK